MDWSLLGFQGLSEVFNIHPVFVHFPVALFPVALFFYAVCILAKTDRLELSGRLCLLLAAISTIPTVITGQLASGNIPHNQVIHRLMTTHQKLGYAVLILGAGLVIWSWLRIRGLPRKPRLFLLSLTLVNLVVLQNGDLGGRMVFVEGAGVKKAVPAIQSGHKHDAHQQAPRDEAPHKEEGHQGHHKH